MAPPIHDALDQLLETVEEQDFDAESYLAPGPDPTVVRGLLEEIGLAPPRELVDFLSWRNVIHPRGSAPLFWETEYWSFATMLRTYQDSRRFGLADQPVSGRLSWPGPPSWFPVLMTDPAEIVAVDCGESDTGSVWFVFTQDTPFRMYRSLVDAVTAARRAIETGAWWFDPSEGVMRAHRDWMPWPGDVDPWAEPRPNQLPPA